MDQIQPYIDQAKQIWEQTVQPQLQDFLVKYNLPTTLADARQDFANIHRPFTHQIEQKITYFVSDYNISYLELILIVFLTYVLINKFLGLFKCEKIRYYRDYQDRTFGFFEGMMINTKSKIFQFLYKNVPFVRKEVNKTLNKAKEDFKVKMSETFTNENYKLPYEPLRLAKIQERLDGFFNKDEALTNKGQLSGTKYCISKYESEMKEFVKNFIFHNPLHASEFAGSRQMESEVIKMTCALYNHDKDYAITTQGGSESIMMGVLAHRNYYQIKKKITKPNIVMPISAHVAFNKACFYYDVELIIVGLNKDNSVNINEVKKAINKNTVMIVGSNPNYAAGVQDNIPELAKIALKHDIGLHVDSCLGSFIMPFAKDLGANIHDFDFKVPGVTSISCDHHKYGAAPKGISLCMFKTAELRQACYFSYGEWPGGLYATAQPAGSRSAAPIAGAWYGMMYHGIKGYKENAEKVMGAVKKIRTEIEKNIPQLELLGSPDLMVIAFSFKKGFKASIYQLDNEMHTKGWLLAGLQKPNAVHVAVTLPFSYNADQFVKDLKETVKALEKNPDLHRTSTSGSVGLYGASGQIPDAATKEKVLSQIVDSFTSLSYRQNANGKDKSKKSKK